MGDQQKALTKWVQILIESEMQGVNEVTIQKALSYFMKMLSGRFGARVTDEKVIKNQLIRQAKTNQQQLRVQELLNKLDKYPAAIQNKSAILHLLFALSNSAEIKQHFDNVEALFKNNNQGINTTMEIENNTTMNTLANNQSNNFNQTQRSFLGQSNIQFLQTIKKISNKGNPNIDLTEKDLIRDLLFTFQAIDGHYITLNKQEDKFMLKNNVSVSDPVREMVNKLAGMGDLFRKIQIYLQGEPQGQIRQALHQAIRDELNEYYRLIAIFENELNASYNNQILSQNNQSLLLSQASYQNPQQNNENNQNSLNLQNGFNPNQFTLRKLQLWVIEPMERLKWLAIICDATKGMSGFQVISAVNAYETQGSPPIQQLISRILQSIVQPFIKYVNSWVYNGELSDPLGEFFVTENVGEADIWNKRYSMVIKQIPNIIDKHNAITIFNIGRSVNFLHKSCKSSDWKLNLAPCNLKIVDKKSFDVFKQWIYEAALLTNNRIVNILVDRYQLKQHLLNIKRYILMGQGDFIQSLMEVLSEQLSKNANEIHRHNLLSILDGVIKGNNNAFQESSQRLDIKLLEASPGDKGWDIFTLDYNVDSPIDTILSPSVMRNYLKIFNFLWRVRRVSHCLSQVWLDHMKSANLIGRERNHEPISKLMKKFNILRHQMTHFLNNLTCYIMVDAIETTWKQFLDDFDKTKDFAEIIQTHINFVQSVLDKSLLTDKNINIYRLMNSLFNLIIKFRNTQMIILTEIQEEYERIRAIKNTNKQKAILSQFGHDFSRNKDFDQEDDGHGSGSDHQLESEDFQIPQNANQFNQIQKDFQKQFTELLILLKKEDKLRFLSFKLDFNEYYNSRQNESLANFGQDQLNKYSASGTLRMQNFNVKVNSSQGSSQNLGNEIPTYNNNTKLFNLGQHSNSLPPNRETSQFFKPDVNTTIPKPNNFGADLNTKDSFFSSLSNNNNLKNSGFIKKDSSFLQNNSLFNQDQSSIVNNSKNNLNKTNLTGFSNLDINSQKSLNNFFQGKSNPSINLTQKQDFFKPSSGLPSNRSYKTVESNYTKMEEESNVDRQSGYQANLFSKNNQFSNNFTGMDSEAFKQRISNQQQFSNEDYVAQNRMPQPQQNNFFQAQNKAQQRVNSRNNLSRQQEGDEEEDQKYQDSDQKNYNSQDLYNKQDQDEQYEQGEQEEYEDQYDDQYINDQYQHNDEEDDQEDHNQSNYE
ncbi:hypothetical protein ABPG74_005196 [Tetrahymena malaccensis]